MRPSRWYVRRAPIALAVVFAVGVVPGCGRIEVGTGGEISAADVAAQAEKALAPRVDGEPTITCEQGLRAEDGDRTTCSMAIGDETYRVDATVSRLDGSQYSLDFHSVDYRSAAGEGTIFADEIAHRAQRELASRFDAPPQVSCPRDLAGVAGRSVGCTLRAGGAAYDLTATVREIEGSEYRLGFELGDRRDDASA